jgi:pyridoxamine 5'-phosphate oxidase
MNSAELFGTDIAPDATVEDPLELLGRWLARAGGAAAGTDHATTPLMALATLDAEGFPRVRHVLLSSYDAGGLHFHTDDRTEKAGELRDHPRAGATLVWPQIPRQLTLSGRVVVESDAEAAAAYRRRTRYLQLLAWVNTPELAQRPTAERHAAFETYDRDHAELAPPPTWRGFVLLPERISFWRGGPEGPSQRLSCRRDGADWSMQRLPG